MKTFEVLLTQNAASDLNSIHAYIANHDCPEAAGRVLDQIEEVFTALSEFPERGNYPPELAELGMREFRERFFKPYRIIYRVLERKVYVLLIADGRREMQSLLERRLLSDS